MEIPRLHPDTIEEIKQKVDIVDVISGFVVLRKRGKDFVGLCPFHEEKSPSFTVSPSKQMYYCFGCGIGGNAIKFLMELGKRSFSEVVLDLAKRYQVPIKTLEPEQRAAFQRQLSLREQLYEILALTTKFYEHILRQDEGKIALEYLREKRLLKEETIQKFQLGYAPQGWETLYSYLVEQKHFPAQLVEQAGLIVPRKSGSSGYYDRFRYRVMIPIWDIQGRVIGFGGRSLGDELPKYLNSPETELFDKGKTLFALDKAKTAISKQDSAIVVEGYFDTIALHEAGINQVVASLGTALSLEQVKQILRYTESKQIILNFDADNAGQQAASRAIGEIEKLAYRGETQLRILTIPDGKDADEFLKSHSVEAYQELIKNAPLWLDWQIQQIIKDRDLKKADHYTHVTQEIVKLLNNITDDNQLTHYLQKSAEILSQGDIRRISLLVDSLINQVVSHWTKLLNEDGALVLPLFIRNKLKSSQKIRVKGGSKEAKTTTTTLEGKNDRGLLERAEGTLLKIYLHCPEYRQSLLESMDARDVQFSLSHHRFLWRQILILDSDIPNMVQLESSDLISRLQNSLLEMPEHLKQVSHLFHLDDLSEKDIYRAPLALRAAIACLEQILSIKRKKVALEMWQKTDLGSQRELAEQYHQQVYMEQEWIAQLETLRQANFYDLISFG
ncbi:MAG: DNA primase [Microcoleaceae cyanobacterium]